MTDRTEMIAAFLDGRLDDVANAAFEAQLAHDEALAEEVARYAANDDLLRAAFDGPMHEGVDAELLQRMGLADPGRAQPAAPVQAPAAANDNPPFLRRWQWPVGGAIAASLALLAVMQLGRGPVSNSEFAMALNSAPSATSVQLADGGSITPRLTFMASDGRYCREYLQSGGAGDETGIACLRDGTWQIEARLKGGAKLPDSGTISAASGEGSAELDAAYARLGGSDPISAEAERSLIQQNWSRR
jgi:hypothetical protein